MNAYYWLVIIFSALATLCGFLGHRKNTKEGSQQSTGEIKAHFDKRIGDLTTMVQEARGSKDPELKKKMLDQVEDELSKWATEFHSSFDVRVAEDRANIQLAIADQLKKSKAVRGKLLDIQPSITKLAETLNEKFSDRISFTALDPPVNLFMTNDSYWVLLCFANNDNWFFKIESSNSELLINIEKANHPFETIADTAYVLRYSSRVDVSLALDSDGNVKDIYRSFSKIPELTAGLVMNNKNTPINKDLAFNLLHIAKKLCENRMLAKKSVP